jgi:hypothetical protein
MAQVNFPNYPKSPADIRSSEHLAARRQLAADGSGPGSPEGGRHVGVPDAATAS